jgi:hypothetical protein
MSRDTGGERLPLLYGIHKWQKKNDTRPLQNISEFSFQTRPALFCTISSEDSKEGGKNPENGFYYAVPLTHSLDLQYDDSPYALGIIRSPV